MIPEARTFQQKVQRGQKWSDPLPFFGHLPHLLTLRNSKYTFKKWLQHCSSLSAAIIVLSYFIYNILNLNLSFVFRKETKLSLGL